MRLSQKLSEAIGDGAGPGGFCECPECGHSRLHKTGEPCERVRCPKCGSMMARGSGCFDESVMSELGEAKTQKVTRASIEKGLPTTRGVRDPDGVRMARHGTGYRTSALVRREKSAAWRGLLLSVMDELGVDSLTVGPGSQALNGELLYPGEMGHRESGKKLVFGRRQQVIIYWHNGKAVAWRSGNVADRIIFRDGLPWAY